MKKIVFILLALPLFALNSCKSDDASNAYPKTVNIKYEVITTNGNVGYINRTINNATVEEFPVFPYSFTYAQEVVELGTYLKLTYTGDNGVVVEPNPMPTPSYEVELKISVDNEVVASETATVTPNTGQVILDYTFP